MIRLFQIIIILSIKLLGWWPTYTKVRDERRVGFKNDSRKYLGSKVRSYKTIDLFSYHAINSGKLPTILGC